MSTIPANNIIDSNEFINLFRQANKIQNDEDLEAFRDKVAEISKTNKVNELVYLDKSILHCAALCLQDRTTAAKIAIPLLIGDGSTSKMKDTFGNTPLIWAIANANHLAALELINNSDESVLNIKSTIHDNAAIHLIVGKGYKDISKAGDPCAYSSFDLLRAIIARGADVNQKNAEGNTALHLACARRDIEMTSYLVQHGADKNIKNKDGKTPAELLHNTFVTSEKLIKEVVGNFFLLDESAYQRNLESAQEALKEPLK